MQRPLTAELWSGNETQPTLGFVPHKQRFSYLQLGQNVDRDAEERPGKAGEPLRDGVAAVDRAAGRYMPASEDVFYNLAGNPQQIAKFLGDLTRRAQDAGGAVAVQLFDLPVVAGVPFQQGKAKSQPQPAGPEASNAPKSVGGAGRDVALEEEKMPDGEKLMRQQQAGRNPGTVLLVVRRQQAAATPQAREHR